MKLDPQNPEVYTGLGINYLLKGQDDEAIANLDKGIKLSHQPIDAYGFRANAYAHKGDYDRAISDFGRVIELDPNRLTAFAGRGNAYMKKGEYLKAVADLEKASRNPRNPQSIYTLAWANLYLNSGRPAYESAARFLDVNGAKQSGAYAVLVGYLGLRKDNRATDAKAFLTKWSAQLDANSWPAAIARFLNGEITADELLKLAGDNDKLTEAHAYIGEAELLERKASAWEHFNWVKENGNKTFSEYNLAVAELGRLASAPGPAAPPRARN
jgi:tetratricopeptide (TPR) repeat protein